MYKISLTIPVRNTPFHLERTIMVWKRSLDTDLPLSFTCKIRQCILNLEDKNKRQQREFEDILPIWFLFFSFTSLQFPTTSGVVSIGTVIAASSQTYAGKELQSSFICLTPTENSVLFWPLITLPHSLGSKHQVLSEPFNIYSVGLLPSLTIMHTYWTAGTKERHN